jgi:hypothetical protein
MYIRGLLMAHAQFRSAMRKNDALGVILCIGLSAAVFLSPARADDEQSSTAPVDKNQYNLFNPTPREQMREFNPNRPDSTEGPYTIDAGHFQMESSFAEYTLEHASGTPFGERIQTVSVLPTDFRIGVLNNVEADVVVQPLLYQRTQQGNSTHYADGFGDTQLRASINFLGNDGGPIAVGVIPFITFPTASNSNGLGTGRVQGGIIFPLQLNLPHDFELGMMAELDIDRNDANTDYGLAFIHSIVLGHPIWGPVSGYIEYFGVAPHQLEETYQAFADTGVTYLVVEDVQLDCGVQFGLSQGTPDYTIVAGITVRH